MVPPEPLPVSGAFRELLEQVVSQEGLLRRKSSRDELNSRERIERSVGRNMSK